MAMKKLGVATPSATTNTTLYTVPALKSAVAVLNVCNTNAVAVNVRVAISATATPSIGEWIEYDVQIAPNGVLERTGLMMNAAKYLVVYASNANVSVSAYGIETSTV